MNQIPDRTQFAADADTDWVERPSRLSGALYRFKVAVFRSRRMVQNLTAGLRRLEPAPVPEGWVLLAEARGGLWTESRSREHRHQRGKVENLRRAASLIGAGRLPAGQVFSFWKQIGKATRRRGFVDGRMIQEGCLVPSVGGGLCQLSNALYDVARRAGCEIVERHGHSKIVPGSAATHGDDATVAWNYVDLRFRHTAPLHIEVRLTADQQVVRIHGPPEAALTVPVLAAAAGPAPRLANACDSCGQVTCHRHAPASALPAIGARTVWLLDDNWPEFQAFRAAEAGPQDLLGLPLDGARRRLARYGWRDAPAGRTHEAAAEALLRSAAVRRLASKGPERRRAELAGAAAIARSLSRLLTQDDLEVVVAQSLLPFLWQSGRLGGRRFSVLMTRLPMAELQRRLDAAHDRSPAQTSLADFRAPPDVAAAETEALAQAHRIIAPHAAVAALFGPRARRLDWQRPSLGVLPQGGGRRIAFPGPTAARKGAFAVREAALALDLEVAPLGSALEGADFWNGVRLASPGLDWLSGVAAVVQPAIVEEAPRRLLAALAAGVPVIATPACGLDPQPGLTLIPESDPAALIAALSDLIA